MICALVLGSADTLWTDLARLELLTGAPWTGPVVACNDAGWAWPHRLDHWVSLDPARFATMEPLRTGPDGYLTWTAAGRKGPRTDRQLRVTWGDPRSEGSSGMFGLQVALSLYDRAVLCGVPIEARGHVEGYTSRDEFWPAKVERFQNVWRQNEDGLRPRTRSMSGFTRGLFGEPTRQWLEGR